MNLKKEVRLRRAAKTRRRIKEVGAKRLCVHKSANHIYAQIIDDARRCVLVSASTLDKKIKTEVGDKKGIVAAAIIGKTIAERALDMGCKKVAFDRSGFKYHGRIKALADSARENGLDF